MSKDNKLDVSDLVLCDRLRRMKFSSMAKKLEAMLEDPLTPNKTFAECATELVNAEWDARAEKKYKRLLEKAGLKFPDAAFDEKINRPERNIDLALLQRLSSCDWIKEGKVLLVTGKTGTGKSYLACAIANIALRKSMTVFFCSAEILMAKAELAEKEKNLLEFINEMADYDLLVIDDFGLMSLSPEKCTHLFTILNARERRKAIIITSQCPVADWYDMFAENTHADACLDRVTKGSFRLLLEGPSLRE